jgi:hypothetical protein
MRPHGSVTCLLAPVRAGDPAAARRLWERDFERLVGLVHKKPRGSAPGGGDAQDAGLGRSARLADRSPDSDWG